MADYLSAYIPPTLNVLSDPPFSLLALIVVLVLWRALTLFLTRLSFSSPPPSRLELLLRATMAAIKLLNLFAVISLALFASNLNTPVNALSTGLTREHHLNRQIAHEAIARRNTNNSVQKRASNKRCKPRTSSALASSSKTSLIAVATSSAVEHTTSPEPAQTTSHTTTKAQATTSPKATPTGSSSSGGSAPVSGGGSGCNGKKLGIALDGWSTSVLDQLANSNAGW